MIGKRFQASLKTELNRLDKRAESEQSAIASHQMKLDGINVERKRVQGFLTTTAEPDNSGETP